MNDTAELFRKQLDSKYNDHHTDTVLKNLRQYLDEMEDSIMLSIVSKEQIDPVVVLYWTKHIKMFAEDIHTADIIKTIDMTE